MQLVYFANVREMLGCSEESYELPTSVTNVGELIDHLRTRNEQYATALDSSKKLRIAVNQTHARLDHTVTNGDEIAIFPPVTGG